MPSLLLKLVVAHLAGDYALQSDRAAANKHTWAVLLRHALFHAATLGVVALTCSPRPPELWLGLSLLLLSHVAIDAATARFMPAGIPRLVVDQTLHATALLLAVLALAPADLAAVRSGIAEGAGRRETWWLMGGLLSAVWTGGVVVGFAVKPYARRVSGQESPREGLARAGRTIGYCERALIYVFMVCGTESLIGFVIAAKALMRLPEARDPSSRESSEYYLVGTLFSIVWAVAIGLGVRAALHR